VILVLAANAARPNRVIAEVVRVVREAGEEAFIASVSRLSFIFENGGQVKLHHRSLGTFAPEVVFYWLGGRGARSTLDTLHHAGYRLVNPVDAWRTGRNKAMQLAAFEANGIPHPWSFFTYAGWPAIEGQVDWGAGEYVFKPHNAGRGRAVQKAADSRAARSLLAGTRRYRQGVLVQEYMDHAPKPRHHYRINVVGGKPVTGGRLFGAEDMWITNQARGGRFEGSENLEDIPKEVIDISVAAVEAIGADYSGVDVIEGQDGGFYVLETNELPGFGTATATHLGRHIVELVRTRRIQQAPMVPENGAEDTQSEPTQGEPTPVTWVDSLLQTGRQLLERGIRKG